MSDGEVGPGTLGLFVFQTVFAVVYLMHFPMTVLLPGCFETSTGLPPGQPLLSVLGAAFNWCRNPRLTLESGWASSRIRERCQRHLSAPVTLSGAHWAVCTNVRGSKACLIDFSHDRCAIFCFIWHCHKSHSCPLAVFFLF